MLTPRQSDDLDLAIKDRVKALGIEDLVQIQYIKSPTTSASSVGPTPAIPPYPDWPGYGEASLGGCKSAYRKCIDHGVALYYQKKGDAAASNPGFKPLNTWCRDELKECNKRATLADKGFAPKASAVDCLENKVACLGMQGFTAGGASAPSWSWCVSKSTSCGGGNPSGLKKAASMWFAESAEQGQDVALAEPPGVANPGFFLDQAFAMRVLFGTDAQGPIVFDPGPAVFDSSPGRGLQILPESREFLLALLAYVDWVEGNLPGDVWGKHAKAQRERWRDFDYFERPLRKQLSVGLSTAEARDVWLRRLGVAAAVVYVKDYPWSPVTLPAADFHLLYDWRVGNTGPIEKTARVFFGRAVGAVETIQPQTSMAELRYGVVGDLEGVAGRVPASILATSKPFGPPVKTSSQLVTNTGSQWFWFGLDTEPTLLADRNITTGAVWDTNPKVAADNARLAWVQRELDLQKVVVVLDSKLQVKVHGKTPLVVDSITPEKTPVGTESNAVASGHASALRAVTTFLTRRSVDRTLKPLSNAAQPTAGFAPRGFPGNGLNQESRGVPNLEDALESFGQLFNDRGTRTQVALSLLRAMNVPIRMTRLPYLNHRALLSGFQQTSACSGSTKVTEQKAIVVTSGQMIDVASGWGLVAPTVGRMLLVAGFFSVSHGRYYLRDSLAAWFDLESQRNMQAQISNLSSWNLLAPGQLVQTAFLRFRNTFPGLYQLHVETVRSFCELSLLQRWPVLAAATKSGWEDWAKGDGKVLPAKLRMLTGSPIERRRAMREFFEVGEKRVFKRIRLWPGLSLTLTLKDGGLAVDPKAWATWGALAVPNEEPVKMTPQSERFFATLVNPKQKRPSGGAVPPQVEAADGWLDCDEAVITAVANFAGLIAGM